MATDSGFQRTLVVHAGRGAFAPLALSMMGKLGYRILDAEELEQSGAPADLLLVDADELERFDGEQSVPVIAMVSRTGRFEPRPGVAGVVKRPASLHGLYRLVQEVLEDHPRATPRVPTELGAVCRFSEGARRVPVLSLSQNGCMIETSDAPPLGAVFDMHLELPGHDPIAVEAEIAYSVAAGAGVIFRGMSVTARYAIAAHVTALLRQR